MAAPLSEAVADQIAYLQTADQIVTDYVAALGERKAELSRGKAGEHYAAIQAQLEEAFPDYAFPDMISFSVYGLVEREGVKRTPGPEALGQDVQESGGVDLPDLCLPAPPAGRCSHP